MPSAAPPRPAAQNAPQPAQRSPAPRCPNCGSYRTRVSTPKDDARTAASTWGCCILGPFLFLLYPVIWATTLGKSTTPFAECLDCRWKGPPPTEGP